MTSYSSLLVSSLSQYLRGTETELHARQLQLQDGNAETSSSSPERNYILLTSFALFAIYLLYIRVRRCIYPDRYRSSIPDNTPAQLRERQLRQRELQRRSRLLNFDLISAQSATGYNGPNQLDGPERQAAAETYRKELVETYAKEKVCVTIMAGNLVKDTTEPDAPSQPSPEDGSQKDVESGNMESTSSPTISSPASIKYVQLQDHHGRRPPQPNRVQGVCAICLEEYETDDKLIFSSNKECLHAFHEECITDYLVLHHLDHRNRTVQDESSEDKSSAPCPCCRRHFI